MCSEHTDIISVIGHQFLNHYKILAFERPGSEFERFIQLFRKIDLFINTFVVA